MWSFEFYLLFSFLFIFCLSFILLLYLFLMSHICNFFFPSLSLLCNLEKASSIFCICFLKNYPKTVDLTCAFSAVPFLLLLTIVSSTGDEIIMIHFVTITFFLNFSGSVTVVQSFELCLSSYFPFSFQALTIYRK